MKLKFILLYLFALTPLKAFHYFFKPFIWFYDYLTDRANDLDHYLFSLSFNTNKWVESKKGVFEQLKLK